MRLPRNIPWTTLPSGLARHHWKVGLSPRMPWRLYRTSPRRLRFLAPGVGASSRAAAPKKWSLSEPRGGSRRPTVSLWSTARSTRLQLAAGLLLTGTYQTIQNALVCLVGLMSLVFCAVAGLTAPDIGDLIAGVLIPRLPPGSLLTVLALIGTTFVSYNLFLHASTALERWPDASRNDENIRESRRDTVFSVVLGGLITAAVVVAASPLLGQGADAANAAAVAERLAPLLGRAAPVFFGLGLFAAGLTSAITAPLAAAYAAGGALGWPPDLRSGRFRLLWGFVLATGVFCAVALGGSPYYVILLAQAGNGLVLPLTLILLLMVANKTRIMGTHRNSRLTNVLGVIVVLVISWLALLQLARVLGRAG